MRDVKMADRSGVIDDNSKSPLSTDECAVTDWQLPSLHFRPLSLLQYSQEGAGRTRSSEPIKRSDPPPILSPTPERPMSSQSRRRFSKILGMDENDCSPVHDRRHHSRSYYSLNAGNLKRVLETSEIHYPSRYTIPPFSPRNSLTGESVRDKELDMGSADHEHESGCEKSTVELLLDKHIECLGLQPGNTTESVEERDRLVDEGDQASMVSPHKNESATGISGKSATKHRPQARAESFASASSTTSLEQPALLPRRLFCTDKPRAQKLSVAHSSPCVTRLASHDSAGEVSTGWNTIASTSNIVAADPTLGELAIRSPSRNGRNLSSKAEFKEPSTMRVSPPTSTCWSTDNGDLYNWDDNVPINQRSRQRALERQISRRHKTRMRLKLKRNSQSQSRICPREHSSGKEILHTARATSLDRAAALGRPCKPDILTSGIHERVMVETYAGHAKQNALTQASENDSAATSLTLPRRRSTVVAIATPRTRQSAEVRRNGSARSIRSHCSNGSKVEPPKSARLSAIAPHLDTPDLGPPLTPMSLNMSFAFPPVRVTAPPGLRPTQSSFSDESSAVRNPRSSLRKRFNLPSLRGVLPSSSRAQSIADVPGKNSGAAHPRLHHSCQMQGIKQEEEECDVYGTVGMSDFAYCRMRMLERVKSWWKRHSMQRKLGLRRRNGDQGALEGHRTS